MDIKKIPLNLTLSFEDVKYLFSQIEEITIDKLEGSEEGIQLKLDSNYTSKEILIVIYKPTLTTLFRDLKNIGWKEYSLSE